jgi:hypothetical protein
MQRAGIESNELTSQSKIAFHDLLLILLWTQPMFSRVYAKLDDILNGMDQRVLKTVFTKIDENHRHRDKLFTHNSPQYFEYRTFGRWASFVAGNMTASVLSVQTVFDLPVTAQLIALSPELSQIWVRAGTSLQNFIKFGFAWSLESQLNSLFIPDAAAG